MAGTRTLWVDRLLMLLVGLIPAIYAWATWDHSGSRSLSAMRQFGFPALAVELLLIGWCIYLSGGVGAMVRRLSNVQAGALIIVIFAAVYSSVTADKQAFSTYKTIINLIHLIFAFGLCSLLSTHWADRRDDFIRFVLAAFGIYLLTVILYIATAPPGFDWMFFGMTAQNVRNLGSHMMTVAALAMGAIIVLKGRWRGFAFIIASIAMALLFWSGSRGPFLGVVLAILLGAFALPWKRAAMLLGVGILSGVTGALLSFLHVVPDARFGLMRTLGLAHHTASSDLTSGRLEVWRTTIEYLQTMPIWGYGDGLYFTIVTDLRPRLAFPHNVELQLLFQWGWIAGGLAIILLLWLMWRGFWITRAAPDLRLPGLLVLIAIFTLGHLDGPFYDTLPMGLFAIGAAICLARKENPPPILN